MELGRYFGAGDDENKRERINVVFYSLHSSKFFGSSKNVGRPHKKMTKQNTANIKIENERLRCIMAKPKGKKKRERKRKRRNRDKRKELSISRDALSIA